MKRIAVWIGISIFGLAALAYAQGNVSVPYTADQLLAIKWAYGQAQDPVVDEGSVTNGQASTYGIAKCQDIWDSYVTLRSKAKEIEADIRTKYLGLSDAEKAAVEAYINTCISSGCP